MNQFISYLGDFTGKALTFTYLIIYLDAFQIEVEKGIRVINKALYCIIALYLESYKDIISISIDKAESASYLINFLDKLKGHKVQDICIVYMHGASGFKQAIQIVFLNVI